MPNEDFQMEDELADSLRKIQPTGKASILRENFDGKFRRGQLEGDARPGSEKKRQRKQRYKIVARRGGVYGTVSEKLFKQNKRAKQENDEAENRQMVL